jgi:hypothetical protein
MNIFKRKSRAEILDAIIDDTLKNLLILDLTNAELATVINSLHDQGLDVLERRAEELENELNQTVAAIASFNQ